MGHGIRGVAEGHKQLVQGQARHEEVVTLD